MPVLVVGSVAIDSIETPHGLAQDVIGGSATHFSVTASLFTRVQLVGVVGTDYPGAFIDVLRERDIDLAGLAVEEGKSFRWTGRYKGAMNEAETLRVELNLFGEFRPEIPPAFRRSRYVFLANGSPHTQRSVLDQLEDPAFVLVDTMNLWIVNERKALEDLLRRVDALVVNDGELRLLTGEQNLIAAARAALRLGPKVLIVKKGEHGAMLLSSDGRFFALPAFPVERVVDPTGAGDTFAGGVMGYLATHGHGRPGFTDLQRALVFGIVTSSFNVEDWGLSRIARLDFREVADRFRRFLDYLRVED